VNPRVDSRIKEQYGSPSKAVEDILSQNTNNRATYGCRSYIFNSVFSVLMFIASNGGRVFSDDTFVRMRK
jgi:hypothetical protein